MIKRDKTDWFHVKLVHFIYYKINKMFYFFQSSECWLILKGPAIIVAVSQAQTKGYSFYLTILFVFKFIKIIKKHECLRQKLNVLQYTFARES